MMARQSMRRRMTPEQRLTWAGEHTPDSVKLAEALCITARVTTDLLRATRRIRFPTLETASEAEFWWGPLIAYRSLDVAFMIPEIAARLRRQTLAGRDLPHRQKLYASLRAPLQSVWPNREPLVRREDKIIEALHARDADDLDQEFRSILSAIAREDRPALCSWAVGLLERIPELAERSTARVLAALAYAKLHGGLPNQAQWAGTVLAPEEASFIASHLPSGTINVRWFDGQLLMPAEAAEGDARIEVSGAHDQELVIRAELPSEAEISLRKGAGGDATVLADGRRALSWSADGTLRLWDLEVGTALYTFKGHTDWVWGAMVLADDRRALSWSADGTLRLWDLDVGTALHTFEGHTGWIWGAMVLADDRRALSWSADGTLRLWDLDVGTALYTFEGHADGVWGATVLADDRRALSWSADGTLRLWALDVGTALYTFEGHTDSVRGATIVARGRLVLSWSEDGTLRLWDLDVGTALYTFEGHADGVRGAMVLADDRRALSWSADGTLRLWDLDVGTALYTFEGHADGVWGATVLADDRRALSWSADGTLRLWDLETGTELLVLSGHEGGVRVAEFSPDGSQLVSSGDDGTLRLWDVASGAELFVFRGHEDGVRVAGFSPDGSRLVSSGDDGTLRLWDMASGEELLVLRGQKDGGTAAGRSPEGTRTASDDGTVRVRPSAQATASADQPVNVPLPLRINLPDGASYSFHDRLAANRRLDALFNDSIILIERRDTGQGFLGMRVNADQLLATLDVRDTYRGAVRFTALGSDTIEQQDGVLSPTPKNDTVSVVRVPSDANFRIMERPERDELPSVLAARAGVDPDAVWWSFRVEHRPDDEDVRLHSLAVIPPEALRRCAGSPALNPRDGTVHGMLVVSGGEPICLTWPAIDSLLASAPRENARAVKQNMMKQVLTLTLGSSVDVQWRVGRMEPSVRLRSTTPLEFPGGCGINVSRVIHILGGKSLAIQTEGGITGHFFRGLVEHTGLRTRTIPIGESTQVSATIFDDSTGREYMITPPGPKLTEQEWQACYNAIFENPAQIVVANGSLPRGVPNDFYGRVAKRAKEAGMQVIVDASGMALVEAMKEGVYLVKPNLRELELLIGRKAPTPEKQEEICRQIIEEGQAEIVALTMGHDGALLVTEHETVYLTTPKVEVKSAAGAGDAFVGGMTFGLAYNLPLRDAFGLGVACGTATVLTAGSELCRREDVERLFLEICGHALNLPATHQAA